MAQLADRDRGIAACAAEVRAFHTFFGAVVLAVGTFHLLVFVPFVHHRTALPVITAELARTRGELASVVAAQRATTASATAVRRFRRTVETTPGRLQRAIGALVVRGRLNAGPGRDPYTATIRVPREGAASGAAEDTITIEEAIRQEIGRQTEVLAQALDEAIEPLLAIKQPPPEIAEALRTAREGIGRPVLSLNEILRAAFARDREFWHRWNAPGAGLGAASPHAEDAARRIEGSLRLLERQLASAGAALGERARALQARLERLQAAQEGLGSRGAAAARMGWLALRAEDAARVYPVVAGGLALTVLVRLRRILAMRRALGGADLELLAPSWLAGAPGSPGRWWALVLVSLPLAAAAHASAAAFGDPGLFVTIGGDTSAATRAGFGLVYALLVLAGIRHLLPVAWGLLTSPQRVPGLSRRASGF